MLARKASQWAIRPSQLITDLKAFHFDLVCEQAERDLAQFEDDIKAAKAGNQIHDTLRAAFNK